MLAQATSASDDLQTAVSSSNMAPQKAAKRIGQGMAVPLAKKPKMDPACKGIIEAVEQANDLSENCRKMLLACIPKAFGTASDDRHETQAIMVKMVGEVLEEVQAKLQQAVDVEQAKVGGIESRKGQLETTLASAEAQLAVTAQEAKAKEATMAEATNAEQSAKALLQEKQEAQKTGDAAIVLAQEEKTTIEQVMATSLHAIVEGQSDDAVRHCSALAPFLKDVDESLMSALPSSCMKKISERGSFDAMVLDQIGTHFKDKFAALSRALDEAAPAAQQRAAAVAEAQAELNGASALRQTAAVGLNVAKAAEQSALVALQVAKDALAAHEPEYLQATGARDDKAAELENFKLYNMASFELLRYRTSAKAIAGA
mmetsp:Transcript_18800/g.52059  ORF Transcript_18800/g.52059 Transcript_18800/m.52059 type:complete len:372 (+) Transcript_18800:1-1116(+)